MSKTPVFDVMLVKTQHRRRSWSSRGRQAWRHQSRSRRTDSRRNQNRSRFHSRGNGRGRSASGYANSHGRWRSSSRLNGGLRCRSSSGRGSGPGRWADTRLRASAAASAAAVWRAPPGKLGNATLPWHVYCDLDGVLADFDTGVTKRTGRPPAGFDGSRREMWKNLAAMGDFFSTLPMMDDGADLWSFLAPMRPTILTGAPSGDWAAPQKRRWCAERLCVPQDRVLIVNAQDKALFSGPGAILVDDRLEHKERWEAHGGLFVHHTSAAASIECVGTYLRQLELAGTPPPPSFSLDSSSSYLSRFVSAHSPTTALEAVLSTICTTQAAAALAATSSSLLGAAAAESVATTVEVVVSTLALVAVSGTTTASAPKGITTHTSGSGCVKTAETVVVEAKGPTCGNDRRENAAEFSNARRRRDSRDSASSRPQRRRRTSTRR